MIQCADAAAAKIVDVMAEEDPNKENVSVEQMKRSVETTALGSVFGSRAWESVLACDEMRSSIVSVDHAPTDGPHEAVR